MSNALPSLIAFDFDGVLTDNRVLVFEDGGEAVFCNRSDGLGFDLLRSAGLRCLIISTERNSVVTARANKLSLPCLQNVSDKRKALVKYCGEETIDLALVMYVGNDLNDLAVMKAVGMPVCPADAHPQIKLICQRVLSCSGGEGVAREIAESILGLRWDN